MASYVECKRLNILLANIPTYFRFSNSTTTRLFDRAVQVFSRLSRGSKPERSLKTTETRKVRNACHFYVSSREDRRSSGVFRSWILLARGRFLEFSTFENAVIKFEEQQDETRSPSKMSMGRVESKRVQSILTGLILKVGIVPVGEEPSLKSEIKKG